MEMGDDNLAAVEIIDDDEEEEPGDVRDGAGDAQPDLGLMLAENFLVRVDFGSMEYRELMQRVDQDPYNALRLTVNFEVIVFHDFQPGNNWEDRILNFAKLNLDEEKVYEVDCGVYVRKDIYINGNGAVVKFYLEGALKLKSVLWCQISLACKELFF